MTSKQRFDICYFVSTPTQSPIYTKDWQALVLTQFIDRPLPNLRYHAFVDSFLSPHSDDECLEMIWMIFWGIDYRCRVCKSRSTYYRVRTRKSYACGRCGTHVAALRGTIFYQSSTPLTIWFYAIYFYCARAMTHIEADTLPRMYAKELERRLGVTYKTAWHMLQKIRWLVERAGAPYLGGDVTSLAMGERERKLIQSIVLRGMRRIVR